MDLAEILRINGIQVVQQPQQQPQQQHQQPQQQHIQVIGAGGQPQARVHVVQQQPQVMQQQQQQQPKVQIVQQADGQHHVQVVQQQQPQKVQIVRQTQGQHHLQVVQPRVQVQKPFILQQQQHQQQKPQPQQYHILQQQPQVVSGSQVVRVIQTTASPQNAQHIRVVQSQQPQQVRSKAQPSQPVSLLNTVARPVSIKQEIHPQVVRRSLLKPQPQNQTEGMPTSPSTTTRATPMGTTATAVSSSIPQQRQNVMIPHPPQRSLLVKPEAANQETIRSIISLPAQQQPQRSLLAKPESKPEVQSVVSPPGASAPISRSLLAKSDIKQEENDQRIVSQSSPVAHIPTPLLPKEEQQQQQSAPAPLMSQVIKSETNPQQHSNTTSPPTPSPRSLLGKQQEPPPPPPSMPNIGAPPLPEPPQSTPAPPKPRKPRKQKQQQLRDESSVERKRKTEEHLNLDHLIRDHEISDHNDSDVLELAENEAMFAPINRKTTKTFDKMKRRRRKIDKNLTLRGQFSSDEEDDFTLDEEQIKEMLKMHVKRKKLRKKIRTTPEGEFIEQENSTLQQPEDFSNKFRAKKSAAGKESSSSSSKNKTIQELNNRRRKFYLALLKREMGKAQKARLYNQKEKIAQCKKVAAACMRQVRVKAMASQKVMKESVWRAKRLTREMQAYWKKFDRVEKQQKKQQEKEQEEKYKLDVQKLEAKRQQRKLNFLITQTELYAHFMAKKIGESKNEQEEEILNRLNEEKVNSMDDYDSEAMRMMALNQASQALERQDMKLDQFEKREEEPPPQQAQQQQSEDLVDREQPDMFNGTLKNYQLKGMNWLMNLYDQGINGILADEMGLGKTIQALSMLSYIAEKYNIWGPFLVITPASTLHNWQQEVSRFVPGFKVIPYWGSPQERKILRQFWNQKNLHRKEASFHLVITSYQLVITDFKYFNRIKWQYLILDEAQAIKSSSSQRWKMLLEFKCRNRLLLSGTPIQNTMAELWALLHFVMPTLFDSHEEFADWFSKDIESSAESKGQIDEVQISRLHMILKPFMLRRIKKDVENELTDKLEVLVYCPLTIRQKHLYTGLKKKIKIEDLLQGLGSQSANQMQSSLMNLVMQFRKVCNHPELFERREARSPFYMKPVEFVLPKLLYHQSISSTLNQRLFSNSFCIFRPDRVHESLYKRREKLEVSEFSYMRIIELSAEDQYQQIYSLLARWKYLLKKRVENQSFVFTNDEFLHHEDVKIMSTPESMWHKIIRSRNKGCEIEKLPEITYVEREPRIIPCQPVRAPNFLMEMCSKVGSGEKKIFAHDRGFAYKMTAHDSCSGHAELIHRGASSHPRVYFRPTEVGGIQRLRPEQGFSNIVIPDKQTLVSDSGKLKVLDGLLNRLKSEGHRVLIYSQMTRMIDLLEEYMWHRKHTFMRLDGSSKISDRRDMVADFQTRSDIFAFLLSTRAGGLGINLTAADTVIFYDSDWNPTVDQQAMDRAHRLGQTKQVTVYRLICKGTIEERILQRAKEKSEIQRMVIQGGSFKEQHTALKPKEVVSLLLDDDEMEKRFQDDLASTSKKRKAANSSAASPSTSKKFKDEESDNSNLMISDSETSTPGLMTPLGCDSSGPSSPLIVDVEGEESMMMMMTSPPSMNVKGASSRGTGIKRGRKPNNSIKSPAPPMMKRGPGRPRYKSLNLGTRGPAPPPVAKPPVTLAAEYKEEDSNQM